MNQQSQNKEQTSKGSSEKKSDQRNMKINHGKIRNMGKRILRLKTKFVAQVMLNLNKDKV